ncbi:MAG: LysR family transcriptional regulator [Deinococcales bacterium]
MLKARSKIWFEDEEGNYMMGPRTARLLAAVEAMGSLSAAAKEAGFSYRAAWNRIKRVEEACGYALLETAVGGQGGGGSSLSREGKALVEAFKNLDKDMQHLLNQHLKRS